MNCTIARNITGQRQAEERERRLLAEAATANAKFRAFFEQGALFAGIMDVDGTLLEANRLSLVACGYTTAPSEKEAVAPESSLRILIVDDNKDSADSLAMLLRMMGHDTRTAYDGQEGVDAVEDFRPTVALLDIDLPKLNGYEACRRIRELSWGRSVVLIAVTGWGQDEDHRLSHDAGFDHHMVKPVDPQALITLLAGLQQVKS